MGPRIVRSRNAEGKPDRCSDCIRQKKVPRSPKDAPIGPRYVVGLRIDHSARRAELARGERYKALSVVDFSTNDNRTKAFVIRDPQIFLAQCLTRSS